MDHRTLTSPATPPTGWPTPRAAWWDAYYLDMASHISTASKDPSTKVGCVLVDERRRVVGLGYNGFPRGVIDSPERYADRSKKYLFVQHAEVNAVVQAAARLDGVTAYVTHPPCACCTGVLIQAGVKRVVTHWPSAALLERFGDSFRASVDMMDEAGVELEYVERQ